MLAISVDDLSGADTIASRVGVTFPVLYTSGDSSVMEAYDVYNAGNQLARPSVFVINPQGEIAWKFISPNYTQRVLPERVLMNIP